MRFRVFPRVSARFLAFPRVSLRFITFPRVSVCFRAFPQVSVGFRGFLRVSSRFLAFPIHLGVVVIITQPLPLRAGDPQQFPIPQCYCSACLYPKLHHLPYDGRVLPWRWPFPLNLLDFQSKFCSTHPSCEGLGRVNLMHSCDSQVQYSTHLLANPSPELITLTCHNSCQFGRILALALSTLPRQTFGQLISKGGGCPMRDLMGYPMGYPIGCPMGWES